MTGLIYAFLGYNTLMYSSKIFSDEVLSDSDCRNILDPNQFELMDLVYDAYKIRKKHFGNKVRVHILDNVQNGLCPEDCGYCGQAKTSDSDIVSYGIKEEEKILEGAQKAYESGAHRYCMVMSGRGPSDRNIERMSSTIKEIKDKFNIKTCLSVGLLKEGQASKLKAAGLDRLNHNLNTSQEFYPEICSSHTWEDRQNTLQSARQAGIELCSGFIVGMGEDNNDRIAMAKQCAALEPESIPINFLLPIKGNRINKPQQLTPDTCVRLLCLFRYMNPKSEIRMAAGREYHLRSLQAMSLYVANSLFAEGYLLSKGDTSSKTLQMIVDNGFEIESDIELPLVQHSESFAPLKKDIHVNH